MVSTQTGTYQVFKVVYGDTDHGMDYKAVLEKRKAEKKIVVKV